MHNVDILPGRVHHIAYNLILRRAVFLTGEAGVWGVFLRDLRTCGECAGVTTWALVYLTFLTVSGVPSRLPCLLLTVSNG